ncbi:RNA polymerase sigma factor [Sunxiuqinia sp. A32]|uniref:RNA polymerase sigma factor n=1 Tax=Sunxiuqinia sp. A32 TaxID=3461496 RepID=UPI0040461A2A
MSNTNDHYYIEQVLKGNTDAYAYLVQKYQDMVYGLALKMLRNEQDAEELAQDTFVKAYRSLSNYEGKSKFSTWLYRITYNSCVTFLRKRKLQINSLDDSKLSDQDEAKIQSQLESVNKEELTKYLQKAMDKLPGDDQVLITFYYYEEQSMDDIAGITNLSVSNVKVKIHRARKKMYVVLKEMLQEEVYSFL